MNINEYAKKWGRDPSNNFAVACFNDNTIEELTAALCGHDEIDMINWGITDINEYDDALRAAIHELESKSS